MISLAIWIPQSFIIYDGESEEGSLIELINGNAVPVYHGSVATSPPAPSPYLFSSLSIHSEPINKCGISFTVAMERFIFIKKGRNGHLLGSCCTWWCFDSDDKRTWQLNYALNTRFLFYLGDGNPLCERSLQLNAMESYIYVSTCAAVPLFHLPSECVRWCCSIHTYIESIYNKWKAHALCTVGCLTQVACTPVHVLAIWWQRKWLL